MPGPMRDGSYDFQPAILRPMLSLYLVGDDPDLPTSLPSSLGQHIPVSVIAAECDEACARQWVALKANTADIVIVDVFLHSGTGIGFLRHTQGVRHRCKTVVLSNFASHDVRRKCLALGADKVFDKTTEIESLAAYCQEIAAGITLN
jgi:two-component system, OmpR family, response regulator